MKHNAEKWFLWIPGIQNLQVHPTLTTCLAICSIMKHTFHKCFSAVQVNHGENCCWYSAHGAGTVSKRCSGRKGTRGILLKWAPYCLFLPPGEEGKSSSLIRFDWVTVTQLHFLAHLADKAMLFSQVQTELLFSASSVNFLPRVIHKSCDLHWAVPARKIRHSLLPLPSRQNYFPVLL